MADNFIGALVATVLTCVLLLALMTAGLAQVALENKRYKVINSFIIAFLSVGLLFSLIVLMYPVSQSGPDINDMSRMDVPSTLFVDPETK